MNTRKTLTITANANLSLIVFLTVCALALLFGDHATATPVAPGQDILLSGSDWWVHEAGAALSESDVVSSTARPLDGWTPATVPGNIQGDLESAHALNPLWYGPGDPRLHEVARKNWWYCKDFVVPRDAAGKRLTLMFHGVDFECKVWVNGTPVGANKGMFRRFWFDIQDLVRFDQPNRIVVWIAAMPEALYPSMMKAEGSMETYMKEPIYNFVDGMNETRRLLKDLKSPANWSYDWGTNIYTLGIWKDVSLRVTDSARIDWVRIDTTLSPDFAQATVNAQLDVDSQTPRAVTAVFTIHGNGANITATTPVNLQPGHNTVKSDIVLPNPALWWPNGQGNQPIYRIESAIVEPDGGAVSDTRSTRFAVRDIRWTQLEGAPKDFINPYQLVVNGRPIRMMGSNLTSPDLLSGRNDRHSRWYMQMAKDAGFNTLRLHGGQVIFSDVMYDAADELGIMLSQEFPIANCMPERDEEFLRNLDITTRNIVKQVRNHPSIVEWSGGNEMSWLQGEDIPALHVFERSVAEEDDAIFRASCAIQGGYHNPYVNRPDGYYEHFNTLNRDYFGGAPLMRYGEFGTQSPANLEVWHREIPPASQARINGADDWVLFRKNAAQGPPPMDQYWLMKTIIDYTFGPRNDLEGVVQGGQFIGAEGLRYAMDALRRRGKTLGGFMNWDFNEPWPNAAGSFMVDYDGRPLMDYYFTKQACAPLSLSLKYDAFQYDPRTGIHADLYLVSDAPAAAQGLRWRWVARDRRGTVFAKNEGQASIDPIGLDHLDTLAIKPPDKTLFGPVLIELALYDAAGTLLSERIHAFGVDRVRGSLGGLLANQCPDPDDDIQTWNATSPAKPRQEKANDPLNLAYVGNGAKEATATSRMATGGFPPANLNDGIYGNGHGWISDSAESTFTIEMAKESDLSLFKLGRDRASGISDRFLEYLKIEISPDGQTWSTAYEANGVSSIPGYSAIKTMTIRTSPTRGRFIRGTVRPLGACIDEFEAYAPLSADTQVKTPEVAFIDPMAATRELYTYYAALPLVSPPITRTTLNIAADPIQVNRDTESMRFTLTNTGTMTALFCEFHPLIEYRTDLETDNNFCSIPPGEKRTVIITATSHPTGGLHLNETGWRISCWNADDLIIGSAANVLLAVGRRDTMCREYAGYSDVASLEGKETATLEGNRVDGARMPFLLGKSQKRQAFQFTADEAATKLGAQLRLHTADRSPESPVRIKLTLNGKEFEANLPKGIGIQATEPFHLAFPYTAVIDIPTACIKPGTNLLEVQVLNNGWFSWDAMDLLTK